MTESGAFLSAKLGGFAFTNDYLLKHGNFFMKPSVHPDGFVYPALSDAARYQVYKDVSPDLPLDFAIKQEKPPTPPASTSPRTLESPLSEEATQVTNGQSKHATWILGKQKLSWDNSTVASYNPDTKMFRCVVCNAVGFLSRIAEHYLGTHTSAKVFQCLHCPYSSTWSRCVRMHMAKHHGVPNAPPSLWKGQPLLEEIFQLLTNLKTTVDSQGRERLDPELCDKKFICPKCPYTTDRRDLYMRHENIHKEDKPYHCYICFKLFNRADHVKKHFLRIHRGHPYDISLVRRRPPRINSSSTAMNGSNGQTVVSSNFSVDKLISTNNDPKPSDEVIDLSHRDAVSSDVVTGSAVGKQLKTFRCSFCTWEGVDSWCLRRHMNVHLKSFECPICEWKAGRAERLFTHVYRSHKKLICTKCKFITELAQEFESHVKECCLDGAVEHLFDKTSEESPNESDEASADVHFGLSTEGLQDVPFVVPETAKLFDHQTALDLKGSVSLMPLHNSISYCYPASQPYVPEMFGGLNRFTDPSPQLLVGVNGYNKTPHAAGKVDIKPELASPVQSSSDSGVADLTSDNNDHDITCWHCGCEFANMSSLKTHTELYHREEFSDPGSRKGSLDHSTNRTKKFSCAICNFNSDKQRTIIEHMRFHTGEVLHCRAGLPCAFKTVCDSTLEKHVETEHNDDPRRCPHCGFLCFEKVPFIRHYRKCHHSKSCSLCRAIKHIFSSRGGEQSLVTLPEAVRPYLHHNPYSKRASAITPYAHCNSAMSRVAVSIPQSLQTAATDNLAPLPSDLPSRAHKSRKQSTPKKLLQADGSPQGKSPVKLCPQFCDMDERAEQTKTKFSAICRRRKLVNCPRSKTCRMNHDRPFCFKNNINFVRHLHWHHLQKNYRCGKCRRRFMHAYQVLLHRRKDHEKVGAADFS